MSLPPRELYRFGEFELDASGRVLQHRGEVVSLTPKAIDTLIVLVRAGGRIVDRDALMKEVWPDTFVEEAGLTRNVSVLRKILENDGNGAQFIETLPKRGYRFIAPIEKVTEGESPMRDRVESDAPVATPPLAKASRSFPRWQWVGSGAVVAIIAVAVMWSIASRPSQANDDATATRRIAVLPFENLTRDPADEWLSRGFADALMLGLRQVRTLSLVNTERVSEVYQSLGVVESAALDPSASQTLSERLGVEYFVQGTYQHVGDSIKVAARLIAVDSNQVRAQETVTDRFNNLLSIQDQLGQRFAAALDSSVPAMSRVAGTSSIEAQQALVEARDLYQHGRWPEALAKSERAIALDPRYAPALALASKIQSRSTESAQATGEGEPERRAAGIRMATEAVDLDPTLYDARIALALANRAERRTEEWRAQAKAAIALNPRNAEGYALLGDSYSMSPDRGCARERDVTMAENYYRTAIALEPIATAFNSRVANLMWAGRLDEAVAVVREGRRLEPHYDTLRLWDILLSIEMNRPIDRDDLGRLGTATIAGAYVHASALARLGDAVAASRELDDADRRANNAAYPAIDIYMGHYYMKQGDVRRAITRFTQAVKIDPACRNVIAIEPLLAADRRVAELAAFVESAR